MKANIYTPAVSFKLLEPSYGCTLCSIRATDLAHDATLDVELVRTGSPAGLFIRQYLKKSDCKSLYYNTKLQHGEHRVQADSDLESNTRRIDIK